MKIFGNRIANVFLYPMLVLTLIGIIAKFQNNLLDISKISMVMLLMTIAIFTVLWTCKNNFKIKLSRNFCCSLVIIGIILTVTWQVNLIIELSGITWWDPSIIQTAAMGKPNWLGKNYFSYYPNTFIMCAFETHIYEWVKNIGMQGFIKLLNSLNIVLLDLSWGLIIYSTNSFFHKKKVTINVSWLSWAMIIVSPYVAIFYSDIPAFFIGSSMLALLSLLKDTNNKKIRTLVCVLIGVISALGYFIKPSTVIVDMALGLVIVIYLATNKNKKYLKHVLIGGGIVVLSFGGVYLGAKYYESHNSINVIDAKKAMPMTEFMAMGLSGNGGYNPVDVGQNITKSTPAERNKLNISLIKQRLKGYGISGYIRFLMKKQILNTNDGTFGWQAESGKKGFLIPFKIHTGIRGYIQRMFTGNSANQNWKGNALWVQFIWGLVVLGMLLALSSQEYTILILKYTVLGGMIFLLLFEGGRTRYLIQFLPYILILSAYGWGSIDFKNLYSCFQSNKLDCLPHNR